MDPRTLSPTDRQFCDAVFDAIDDLARVPSREVKRAKERMVRALVDRDVHHFTASPEQVTLTDAQWTELEQAARTRGSFAALEVDDL